MEADASWQEESTQFNLNRENGDLRKRVEDLSRQNGQLLAELNEQGGVVKEHVSRQRQLEQSRNELVNRNLELETRISRLNIEKSEREAALTSSRKEAQTALIETHALKDQLRELTREKARLSQTIDAAQQERQSIEHERQKYATERELHIESKRWLMNEVAERENKVSLLRFELCNKELEGTSERLQNEANVNFLNVHIERLNEQVEMLQTNNNELHKKMENSEAARHAEVGNMEEEMRCLKDLQKILKNSLEEAKNAADHFRDQLDAQEGLIAEVRTVLKQNQAELEQKECALKEKDEELELARARAAGELREDPSLLQRLAESEDDNSKLRASLEELIDAVNQNRPHLLDKTSEEQRAKEQQLRAHHQHAQRELANVRAELEKCQRDFELVTRRNTELMYAVERQSKANDPNWSDVDDERLFLSCTMLLRRNAELESEIEHVRATAAQEAQNAHGAEMARLREELSVSRKSEEELKATVQQLTVDLESLQERTEHFKELIRDSVSASEARLARLKAEEAVAARIVAVATVERLREQIDEQKTECKRRELELEERCRASETSCNGANETSMKLAAMLDEQKANTSAIELEYRSAMREKEQAHEELRKVMLVIEESERKMVELGRQALEATEQAGTVQVRARALEDELQIARAEVTELRQTNSEQKKLLEEEEQLRTSLIEMTRILEKVEAEKAANTLTQLEMIKQECDSHKATANRLNDQLTHLRSNARLTEQRLERELEVARNLGKEQEEKLAELSSLRSRLLSAQLSNSDASEMTPERLKREYLQLKNELDNANRKLAEAEATQERMNEELSASAAHYHELEECLKLKDEVSVGEQERLRSNLSFFEQQCQLRTDELAQTMAQLVEQREKNEALEKQSDRDNEQVLRMARVSAFTGNTARQELAMTMRQLADAQQESSRNANALEQRNSFVTELEQQIREMQGSLQRLQADLDSKRTELEAERTAKKETELLKEHIERQLEKQSLELEKLKAKESERQKGYEKKLTKLTEQFEALFSSTPTSSGESNNLQSLLQHLRESKNEASQRAMLAEHESHRLRNEIDELEKSKSALTDKIRELELGKISANESHIEKAKLIEKVELMENVHKLNGRLEQELDELRKKVAEQEEKEPNAAQKLAEKSAEDFKTKLSQTRQLAIKYRDELAELKKSLKTSSTTDPCAGRLAALSKSHAEQLADKDTELAELTAKLEELRQEMEQVRSQAMRATLLEKRLAQMSEQLAELQQRLAESDGLAEPRRKRTASDAEHNEAKRTRESSSELSIPAEHVEQIESDEDQDETIQDAPEDAPDDGVDEEEVLRENDSQPSIEDGAEDEADRAGSAP